MAVSVIRTRQGQIINTLLELADVQGYLTLVDVLEVFPIGNEDPEKLEILLASLKKHGAAVLDNDGQDGFLVEDAGDGY